jgi:putative phosphoesterase
MKIAVMSDTHGNVQLAVNALKHIGNIDRLIHLGDHYGDALQIGNKIGIPVDGVSGNTDLNSEPWAYREKTLRINGRRIFITHGDLYKVKHGIDLLIEKAICEDANIALFGHTHFAMKQRIRDILFLNPGCMLFNNPNNSFAILDIYNNKRADAIIIFPKPF